MRPSSSTDISKLDEALAKKDLQYFYGNLRYVMGTPQGRAVFSAIFEAFGLRKNVFNPNGSEMAFRAGKQAVCEWIFNRIVEADAYQLYSEMEKEHFDRMAGIEAERKKMMDKIQGGA